MAAPYDPTMSGSALVRLLNAPLEITATAVEGLAALPRIALALERLAGAATALEGIAGAAEHIGALADLGERVSALADTEEFQAELTMGLEALQRISAASMLDALPDQVEGVDQSISTVGERLAAVEPDVRALAGMVAALDESIRVLAGAVAPLQGTTERLGRLVDRLPRRKDQPAVGNAPV